MDFTEKTLEDIIWDNAQTQEGRKLLSERGLHIYGSIFRQVDLGSYGRADLIDVQFDPTIGFVNITVFELKKGPINVNALMQAARYVTALKRHDLNIDEVDYEVQWHICLIGDSIDKNGDFAFLYNDLDNVIIFTYDFKITGVVFEEVGKNWSHTDEVINEETKNRLFDDIRNQIEECYGDSAK